VKSPFTWLEGLNAVMIVLALLILGNGQRRIEERISRLEVQSTDISSHANDCSFTTTEILRQMAEQRRASKSR